MSIEEAIRRQVDIICTTIEEKATVINILQLNGLSLWLDLGGMVVSLFADRTYMIGDNQGKYTIQAADFITSNT